MSAPLPAYLKNIVPQEKLQHAALQRFLKNGLPTQKQEDWRYTGLGHVEKHVYAAPGTPKEAALPQNFAGDAVAARLVFVNGVYTQRSTALDNLPAGLHIMSLDTATATHDTALLPHDVAESWQDLNTALAHSGFVIHAAKNTVLAEPIEIMFVHDADAPASYHMRHNIMLEEGAALTIVEYHISRSAAPAFITHDQSCTLAAHARLTRSVIHLSGAQENRLMHDQISLAGQATCDTSLIHAGGKITRRNTVISHNGKGAASTLRAVSLAQDDNHIDLVTDMRHMKPGTRSAQQIRTLAGGAAHAIFQGKVLVAQDAQKTEAAQAHHGLLLSARAEIDAKPGLEIYADDVKCSHGATCGALDDTALFYMQSRGITRHDAEKLLLQAFVADIFDDMPDAGLREKILALLAAKLETAHA